jgi:hypothetical protein
VEITVDQGATLPGAVDSVALGREVERADTAPAAMANPILAAAAADVRRSAHWRCLAAIV